MASDHTFAHKWWQNCYARRQPSHWEHLRGHFLAQGHCDRRRCRLLKFSIPVIKRWPLELQPRHKVTNIVELQGTVLLPSPVDRRRLVPPLSDDNGDLKVMWYKWLLNICQREVKRNLLVSFVNHQAVGLRKKKKHNLHCHSEQWELAIKYSTCHPHPLNSISHMDQFYQWQLVLI